MASNFEDNAAYPFVSIVIPTLNEEHYIAKSLRSLLTQVSVSSGEVLVVDGGSSDRTCVIVAEFQKTMRHLRLLHNHERIQAAAMNLATHEADPRSTILIRADAHSVYPSNFVKLILEAFAASEADSIVVPMHSMGRRGFQAAVAAIQNSWLGTGGAAHRIGVSSRFVEHGHHAGFKRATFQSLGGYDPSFTHNEDAEYDLRLRKSGGRIWLCREAQIAYFPRDNLADLARQYYRFGRGRAKTMMLHRARPGIRQLLPIVLLLINIFAVVVAPIFPLAPIISISYLAFCFLWSAYLALIERDVFVIAGSFAAVTMHLSWAIGFVAGALKPVGTAKNP